jgi:hypothetical protein
LAHKFCIANSPNLLTQKYGQPLENMSYIIGLINSSSLSKPHKNNLERLGETASKHTRLLQ